MASLLNLSSGELLKVLPYDAEIEYLESTGLDAYIDTNIIPNTTDDLYCEYYLVKPLNTTNDCSATIFGLMSAWAKNAYMIAIKPYGNRVYAEFGNTDKSVTKTINDYADSWQTMTKNGTTISIMDSNITNTGSGTLNKTLYLFRVNFNPANNFGKGTTKRVRSFKLIRNNTNILDLIPVRKGQVGYMYDKVSGQLFGNAGTGDFILGNDI